MPLLDRIHLAFGSGIFEQISSLKFMLRVGLQQRISHFNRLSSHYLPGSLYHVGNTSLSVLEAQPDTKFDVLFLFICHDLLLDLLVFF